MKIKLNISSIILLSFLICGVGYSVVTEVANNYILADEVNTTIATIDTLNADNIVVGNGSNTNGVMLTFDADRDWRFITEGSDGSTNLVLDGTTTDKVFVVNNSEFQVRSSGITIKNEVDAGHRGSLVWSNMTYNMASLDCHDGEDVADGGGNTHCSFYTKNATFDSVKVLQFAWGEQFTNTLEFPNINKFDIGSQLDFDGNVSIKTAKAPTLILNNSFNDILLGTSIGRIEFLANDGSGAGKGIAGYIESISESGTGQSSGMRFATSAVHSSNSVERMRITNDGKVGIGTPDPNSTLDIMGDLYLQPSSRPTAREGVCYWNTTAGYKCQMCYNSTNWEGICQGVAWSE